MNTTFKLDKHIFKFASNIFINTGEEQLTFDLFYSRAKTIAHDLNKAGVKKEDIVVLNNIPLKSYPFLLLAIWLNKAIAFPVNPKFTNPQIEKIIQTSKASFFISENKPASNLHSTKFIRLHDLLNTETKTNTIPGLDLDAPATIILTSGSSGEPKYVVHSLSNHFQSAEAVNKFFNLSNADNWLLTLPVFHVAGLAIIIRTFLAGATLSIPVSGDSFSQALQKYKPSHISSVTTQLNQLLRNDADIKSLQHCKVIFLGGSSIPKSLISQSLKNDLKLFTSYGLTEMSSTVAIKKIADRQSSQAEVLPIHKIKIMDDEILIKGPCLSNGYLEKRKAEEFTDHSGWFQTKDLGKLDDQGRLTVFGRKDNMFISGGENIYPEEIEKYLMAIEGIEQAVVIPTEDNNFGFRPVAFINPFNKELIPKVINNLTQSLPSFKIPDKFFPIPTENLKELKIDRAGLKQLARQEIKN